MYEPQWTALLPPLLAIILAIATKQVVVSLGIGIWVGYCIFESVNPLLGLPLAIDGVIRVFSDPGDTRVLVFTLVIGGLISSIERFGGVRGFIYLLESRSWVDNPQKAKWLAYGTGLVIFIESNITLLVAGSIARPLFDRYQIAREKLAYIIDSTSAPVCVLIPLNAWGAVILSLLSSSNIEYPIDVFIKAIPLNLYPLAVLSTSAFVIWRSVYIGPMRSAQLRTEQGDIMRPNAAPMANSHVSGPTDQSRSVTPDKASIMIVPIAVMVLSMPIFLFVTGEGDISAGSGSTSVLWAVLLALSMLWLLVLSNGRTRLEELMNSFLQGAGAFLPVSMILLFALALGDVANLLETGRYVAQIAGETVPNVVMLPLLFVISGFIAFSIGSSWGTFAIMIPLSMEIALSLNLSPSLFLASVLSGSVFGDHASPISDTTVVSSLAASTDHIDHVRTQLPYALFSAAIATFGFLLMGVFLL